MRENDIIFLNVHRRYLNKKRNEGGFLGIYLLAAYLNNNGYSAQGYAGQLYESKIIIDEVCKNNNASMVGLYCDYENITENIYLSKYIKEHYNLPVIMGGPQATALQKEFFLQSGCDVIVRYEGELTVLDLVEYFLDDIGDLSKIDGIMYMKNGKLVINKERELIENLDALPFIDEECYLDIKQYTTELSIMTGRGCPFQCAFCHEGKHTKKVRFRSVENVLLEIHTFIARHPNLTDMYILFTDDTFTLQTERVREICEEIKYLQKNINIYWFCEGHIHTLYKHPEMIRFIADAGCHRMQLGIEAGTQLVLDAYEKGSTLEEIIKVVEICKEHKIPQIYSNIILGGAFFDRKTYEDNLEFAKNLIRIGEGMVEIGVVSYWPLAETKITNQPENYNIQITDYDFLTSIGDFPQTKTCDFTEYDISLLLKDMEYKINVYMLEMIEKNIVPVERVLSWFPEKNRIKSFGKWWDCLIANIKQYAYYNILLSREGVGYDILEFEQNLELYHPMRVLPLYKMLDLKRDRYYLQECPIDDFVLRLVVYCTGKLSIADIRIRLAEEFGSSFTENRYQNTLKMLLEKHFIVYMKL